jgi:hypothetical protein
MTKTSSDAGSRPSVSDLLDGSHHPDRMIASLHAASPQDDTT